MKYIFSLKNIPMLSDEEKNSLQKVTDKFAMRISEYYLTLIDWNNPDDPLRKIVLPQKEELIEWGNLDASNEFKYTKATGLEHKYEPTALIILNRNCGGFCRFCFRKRLFFKNNKEVITDLSDALKYLTQHKEINNVLLSGGDPLMLSTGKLQEVLSKLFQLDHIKIVRIGTKMPAYNPYRILEDAELLEVVKNYSQGDKKIYIITQFNHPRELTFEAIEAVLSLQKAGAVLSNQTPILKTINDDKIVLANLLNKLVNVGVVPYYIFQVRPTLGNFAYALKLEEAYEIFKDAVSQLSGLAKRVRFIMSHTTGKIEVLGKANNLLFLRYHEAAKKTDSSKIIVARSNPDAYWFDDYELLNQSISEAVAEFEEDVIN